MASYQQSVVETESRRSRLLPFSLSEGRADGVSASALAAAGFTNAAPGDEASDQVLCRYCDLHGEDFRNHPPLSFHKEFSPHCPFVLSMERGDDETGRVTPDIIHRDDEREPELSEEATKRRHRDCYNLEPRAEMNITVPSSATIAYEPGLKEEKSGRYRQQTFIDWPKESIVPSRELSALGFTYAGEGDSVKCVFCQVEIGDWDSSMNPFKVHMQREGNCLFLKGEHTGNIPDYLNDVIDKKKRNTVATDGVFSENWIKVLDSAKEPAFAVNNTRAQTFLTWPHNAAKTDTEMLEHSLYYTGKGDTVACFSCGVEISHWTPEMDIWERHASESSECLLVSIWKGPDFLANAGPPPDTPPPLMRDEGSLEAFMKSRLVEKAVDKFKYSRDEIRRVFMNSTREFSCFADIVKAVENERARSRMPAIEAPQYPTVVTPPLVRVPDVAEDVEEVPTLAENVKRCSAPDCLRDASFILLPCLHLVCTDCERNGPECPFCGEKIRGSMHSLIG